MAYTLFIFSKNLNIWFSVNGEMLQNLNTNDMIFGVRHVVSYLSQFMNLLLGDVISTGTPFRVGFGFKPPRFLKANEVVELGIDQLGTQGQIVVDFIKQLYNFHYYKSYTLVTFDI